MNRNKKVFGRKANQYYSHRIGAYSKQRSLWSLMLLPILSILILGSFGTFGYIYYQKTHFVLSNETNPVVAEEIPEITQQQVDQKSLQAKEDPGLVKTIQQEIGKMSNSSEWEVSVRDLKSGRMANVNSDEPMLSASMYKLFLLAPLEKKISAEYWKSFVGSESITDCVMAMITASDNDCSQALGNYINWKNADAHNQTLGFTTTKIGVKDNQITSAREVNDIMYRLQNSQILSDKARRIVFDALYEQKFRSGIPAGCGEGCLVGNKTGDIDGYRHDAAIVTHGQAKYVLVIMTKDATWAQIASLAKSIDVEMLP